MMIAIYLISLEYSLCRLGRRRPGNCAVFSTAFLVSEFAEVTEPFIDAVVDDLLIDVHPDYVELGERHRAVEEGCVGSQLPQTYGDDDLDVKPLATWP